MRKSKKSIIAESRELLKSASIEQKIQFLKKLKEAIVKIKQKQLVEASKDNSSKNTDYIQEK